MTKIYVREMSTIHEKLPHNIKLIDELDTFIIDENTLENGSRQSSGTYTINDGLVDDKKIARIVQGNGDNNQNRSLIINDKKGNTTIKAEYCKRHCSRQTLSFYSPTGFLVGSVRERCFKMKADSEIRASNSMILFLLIRENNATGPIIRITDSSGGELTAKVTISRQQDGKVLYTVTYVKKIQVLYKLQILCAVLSNLDQDLSKHKICCLMKHKLEKVRCFPLYYDSKVTFFILCFLFPLVIVMYIIFIIVFVAYFVGTLFTVLTWYCSDTKPDLACVFNWPCRLCKNKHDRSDYCWCLKSECSKWHIFTVGVIIFIFHIAHGWLLYTR